MKRSNRIANLFYYFSPLVLLTLFLVLSCEPERVIVGEAPRSMGGRYVGYSWSGEARGTEFRDAGAYIETILELDEDAIITNAVMRYWQQRDGFWVTRQAGNARVEVDFSRIPVPASIGGDYAPGTTMFDVYTSNLMMLTMVGVSDDGVVAAAVVEPLTRFQFELRFPSDFDFSRPFGDLTPGSGLLVPTVRTSGGGILSPGSWDEISDNTLFDLGEYSHVLTDRGIFQGLDNNSSIEDFLGSMGVEFSGDRPQPLEPVYQYAGIGGWAGNYRAIGEFLQGRNARELNTLVDWTAGKYEGSINDKNQFGVDVISGATRTAQNSIDSIAGATVRMSRESTSYQRALVAAGIISEEDVIIGRF